MGIRQIIKEEIGDFDWVSEIPNNKTVGEIKSTERGFRDFFAVGDTLIMDDGQIPCESIRNEGCFINLTNSEYRVTNVYRTRVEIRPLNPETVNIFIDEWGVDKVWVGVESSDDDIQLHKKPNV